MAFTGVAVVKQVADNLIRITGLSLAGSGAAGTIALHESVAVPGVRLPEGFKPREYSRPGEADVSLQDAIEVWFVYTAAGGVVPAINTVKTGTKPSNFLATLTCNTATEGFDSGALEIYVRWH